MIISIPKEIKIHEQRVALIPSAVHILTEAGHTVYVQEDAGIGSGFSNEIYRQAGAQLTHSIEEAYAIGELIVKVKEPLPAEYGLIRAGQIVFTFFHFASSQELLQAMLDSNSICIAYETVEQSDGTLPLLVPMSEVAGRMATQQGAKYLEHSMGGRGVLLGGVSGVPPAKVLVIGGGVAGAEAAKMAAGLGAQVTILDKNLKRLRHLGEILPPNVQLHAFNPFMLSDYLKTHVLVVGAVLVHGAKAPYIISRNQLQDLQPRSVMVDISIDQGGCFETSRPTTHEEPVFNVNNILHYCVTNMPGVVPYTSSVALSNASSPYALEIANKGYQQAIQDSAELRCGVNVVQGHITYQAVAEAFGQRFVPLDQIK